MGPWKATGQHQVAPRETAGARQRGSKTPFDGWASRPAWTRGNKPTTRSKRRPQQHWALRHSAEASAPSRQSTEHPGPGLRTADTYLTIPPACDFLPALIPPPLFYCFSFLVAQFLFLAPRTLLLFLVYSSWPLRCPAQPQIRGPPSCSHLQPPTRLPAVCADWPEPRHLNEAHSSLEHCKSVCAAWLLSGSGLALRHSTSPSLLHILQQPLFRHPSCRHPVVSYIYRHPCLSQPSPTPMRRPRS